MQGLYQKIVRLPSHPVPETPVRPVEIQNRPKRSGGVPSSCVIRHQGDELLRDALSQETTLWFDLQ